MLSDGCLLEQTVRKLKVTNADPVCRDYIIRRISNAHLPGNDMSTYVLMGDAVADTPSRSCPSEPCYHRLERLAPFLIELHQIPRAVA